MFDVVTLGGATVDLFIRTPDSRIISVKEALFQQDYLAFEYGKKIYVEDVLYTMGGGGNNTAVAFARLGLSTAFIGAIGQDEEGRKILMALKSEGVRTDFISRVTDQNTGLSLIINSFDGDRTVFSFRGANDKLTAAMINWDQLSEASWLYLPSLSGEAHAILEEVIRFAGDKKIKIACNPGAQQLSLGLDGLSHVIKASDVFVLNKEEAELLTSMRAPHRPIDPALYPVEVMKGEPWISDVREILRTIYAIGPRIVVITDGIKGAHAYDGISYYWMPVYPYAPLDTLGAGDAFAASFVAGRIQGKPIEECLMMAAANGSSVVRKYGAQPGLCTAAEIVQIMTAHAAFVPIRESGSQNETITRSLSWG